MASAIDIRFYFSGQSRSARDVFGRLAAAVTAWDPADKEWQELQVEGATRGNVIAQIPGPLPLVKLQRAVQDVSGSAPRFGSGTSFQCWRFKEGRPESGFLRLEIESWDPEFETARLGDVHLEGLARVSIRHPGPFVALLSAESDARTREVNLRVEENLEQLGQLVFRLVEGVQPDSLKLFVDEGWLLPFNAHLVYFRHEQQIIQDLRLINQVFERGMPRHHGLPALKNYEPRRHDYAFHLWRTDEQRRQVQEKFRALLVNLDRVSPDTVQQVLRSGHFDNYEMKPGWCVLEYPHIMNDFVDRFYVEILEAAR